MKLHSLNSSAKSCCVIQYTSDQLKITCVLYKTIWDFFFGQLEKNIIVLKDFYFKVSEMLRFWTVSYNSMKNNVKRSLCILGLRLVPVQNSTKAKQHENNFLTLFIIFFLIISALHPEKYVLVTTLLLIQRLCCRLVAFSGAPWWNLISTVRCKRQGFI